MFFRLMGGVVEEVVEECIIFIYEKNDDNYGGYEKWVRGSGIGSGERVLIT